MNLPELQLGEGRSGPWRVSHFKVDADGAFFHNLREAARGTNRDIRPGTYTSLAHDDRGIVMSNTPAEASDHLQVMEWLEGGARTFLIHGLGLGMIATWLCSDPRVERVDVVEVDQDVIDLVGTQLAHFEKLHIHHGNAFTFGFPPEQRWDAAWHDIWDAISDDNLPEMAILENRYADRVTDQGSWARDVCEMMRGELAALVEQVYIQRGPDIGDEAAAKIDMPSMRHKLNLAGGG